jgi:hypothetical protein
MAKLLTLVIVLIILNYILNRSSGYDDEMAGLNQIYSTMLKYPDISDIDGDGIQADLVSKWKTLVIAAKETVNSVLGNLTHNTVLYLKAQSKFSDARAIYLNFLDTRGIPFLKVGDTKRSVPFISPT